jgi:outer membrane protein
MNYRFLFFIFVSLLGAGLNAQYTLEQCVEKAWLNNLQLEQSQLNLQNAELAVENAKGNFLPNLNGQATHGYNWGQRIDPFTNSFASQRIQSNSFGVSSAIDLFTGGQNWANYKKAMSDAEQASLNLENAKNQLALRVSNAFLSVVMNAEFLKMASATADNSLQQLNRLKKQLSLGAISEANVAEMEAQYSSDAAAQVNAQNNYNLSKLSLAQLIRLSANEMSTFEVVYPNLDQFKVDVPLPPKSLILETALNAQPVIKSAQVGMVSAKWAKKSAMGAYYPRLSASMSLGTGYSGAAKVLNGSPDSLSFPIGTVIGSNDIVLSYPQLVYSADDYKVKSFGSQFQDNVNRSFFMSLTIPIFNGFQVRNNVKRAVINEQNAALNLEIAKQQLVTDVETAYAGAIAAAQTYQANKTSLESNQKSYQWMSTRYENGAINATELSISRNRLDIAKAQMIRAQLDLIFKQNIIQFYMNQPIRLQP